MIGSQLKHFQLGEYIDTKNASHLVKKKEKKKDFRYTNLNGMSTDPPVIFPIEIFKFIIKRDIHGNGKKKVFKEIFLKPGGLLIFYI